VQIRCDRAAKSENCVYCKGEGFVATMKGEQCVLAMVRWLPRYRSKSPRCVGKGRVKCEVIFFKSLEHPIVSNLGDI
jgi:hypothetical protein